MPGCVDPRGRPAGHGLPGREGSCTDIEPNPAEFAALRSPKLRLVMPLIVAVAFLMEQLDATIITTAIPDMARSLHVARCR